MKIWQNNTIGARRIDDLNGHPIGIESLANFIWGRQATDWIIPIVWSICRKYENGVFAEIGTRTGITTCAMALAARDVGGKAYTMDISDQHHESAVMGVTSSGVADYVTFIHASSQKQDFPEPIDVLFIDGDHSYDAVKADYERHAPNVKDDGIILFHDPCSDEGTERFCEEIGVPVIPIEAGLGILCKQPHGVVAHETSQTTAYPWVLQEM